MSSPSCYEARSDPFNAPTNVDVDGIAVSVANIVVHVCLRILVTWSPMDVGEGVQTTLLQIYPILLSTLLSIGRKQLSLFDASFALILTSSPLTVYIVVASICDWFRIETGLYKRIKSHRLFIRTLGASVLFLWFALSVTLRLSDRAFIDSEACKGSTFRDWFLEFSSFFFASVLNPGLLGAGVPIGASLFILIFPPALLLFWDRHQVATDARHSLEGRSKAWRRIRKPWTLVRCAWRTINHDHKWYIYLLFAYIDAGWAYTVMNNAAGASVGYELTYGQVLSAFAVVPPVISTIRFIYSRRWDLLHFVRRFPRLCVVEVVYLVTGIKLAPKALDNHLPLTHPNSSSSGLTLQEVSHEALPEESQHPENPTLGRPDLPAHPGSRADCAPHKYVQSPTSFVADVPLAVVHDLILAHRRDTMTIESVESVCAVHGLSPLITESIVQAVRGDLPPASEEQRDVSVIEPNPSSALANVAPTSAASPTVRRGWTYG